MAAGTPAELGGLGIEQSGKLGAALNARGDHRHGLTFHAPGPIDEGFATTAPPSVQEVRLHEDVSRWRAADEPEVPRRP